MQLFGESAAKVAGVSRNRRKATHECVFYNRLPAKYQQFYGANYPTSVIIIVPSPLNIAWPNSEITCMSRINNFRTCCTYEPNKITTSTPSLQWRSVVSILLNVNGVSTMTTTATTTTTTILSAYVRTTPRYSFAIVNMPIHKQCNIGFVSCL